MRGNTHGNEELWGLELLNSLLVDTSALANEMASCGGLSRVGKRVGEAEVGSDR